MFIQKPKYPVKPQLPEISDHEHLPSGGKAGCWMHSKVLKFNHGGRYGK